MFTFKGNYTDIKINLTNSSALNSERKLKENPSKNSWNFVYIQARHRRRWSDLTFFFCIKIKSKLVFTRNQQVVAKQSFRLCSTPKKVPDQSIKISCTVLKVKRNSWFGREPSMKNWPKSFTSPFFCTKLWSLLVPFSPLKNALCLTLISSRI